MKLLSTGIETLDTQLGGGFPSGSTILILFDPGAGYEIFSTHLVIGGLKNKEKIFYVNTDAPIEEIEEILIEYGVKVEEYKKKGDLRFIDVYTERYASVFPRELLSQSYENALGGYDPLSGLRNLVTDPNKKGIRTILDSLSYFLRSYEIKDVIDLVELMGVFTRASQNLSIIFMPRGMHSETEENTMKHLCDGVIELLVREDGTQLNHYMKFLKMKGSSTPRNLIPYRITERGIEVETTKRLL
jgi:KaiC/GvpD/RAD55 family RecA-like ATPase